MKKSSSNLIPIVTAIVIVAVVAIIAIVGISRDSDKTNQQIDKDTANASLTKMVNKIDVQSVNSSPEQLDVSEFYDTADELPDINTSYPLVVEGTNGNSYVNIEIFSSGEKAAKSGSDSFLTEMAKDFNKSSYKTSDGNIISVSLRSVPSGTAVDYISSGKYIPDGYTPSNQLFGSLLEKDGVNVEAISDRVVGNVAGILVDKKKYTQLFSGDVTAETIINAVVEGKLNMGYSNPYTSATGINFLMTSLSILSPDDILSDNAVKQFQVFQSKIPLVSYTTQQLTTSADKGIIDALVSEYQTYQNDSTLSRNFEFIPFGVRHDNPLYAVGDISDEKREALKIFADYCADNQKEATSDGFNGMDDYKWTGMSFSGKDVAEAQTIWKEEKNVGNTIVAEFIVDVSGSMAGEPINNLRKAMINTIQYIGDTHYVGLIAFNEEVMEYLSIGQFDLTQKTKFKGAVNSLNASGSTGMYNAIMIGIDKVQKKCEEIGGNTTPIIFVLTDGDTNTGYNYNDTSDVIDALDIPVYTISYNYKNDKLSVLSNLNEASYITGTSEDIVYKLKNLFNIEM